MIKQVKLENYIKIISGFAFKSNLFTTDSSFTPLIRIRDIKRGFSETFYSGDFNKNYLVYEGDMLIGMDGEFNVENWKGIPSLLNQRVCKLEISDSNLLDKQYLFYIINGKLKEIEDKTSFVTVKHLSLKDINRIEIPLPPLSTQKAIVEKLDKADALRKKDQELLAQYEELAQAIFIEMFGDPVKNEKGWEVENLSDIGKIGRGKSKHRPRNAPQLLGGNYPLIQTGDVANSGLYIDTYHSTYSEIGLLQSKMWSKGTLCITIAANIAKTGILNFDSCFPDSLVGFVPTDKTNVVYIHYWFSFFQKILEDQAPESAQKNINLEILSKLEIICPPVKLQSQFAEKIQNIEAQKALVKQQAQQSEDLFQALLQESFNF